MKRSVLFVILSVFIISSVQADEGMWIPMFLGELNEAEMQAMGMNITAEDIYSINQSSLKDAIVIFGGGCTGELISSEGLLLTNHHCGYGRIQSHSSLENDYLTDGFWAMDHSEELPNPGLKVTFLVRMEEVTDRVLEDLNGDETEGLRAVSIREKINEITKEATEGTHYMALVKPFFQGNRYFLFVNEVFEDVRLVGAPPSNIGKFGGDTDNWVWPRHTGDFSLFRIYADENNQPAPYSESNVPYTPKKHLKISLEGVKEGDFTFVFGYPGSTQSYIPSYGVDLQVNTVNPVRIGVRDERIDIFNKFMNSDREIRIQYSAKHASISNGWKKWIGENRGIKRLKVIEQKQQFEEEFTVWVNEDDQRTEMYGNLLPAFKALYGDLSDALYKSTYLRETYYGIEVVRYASNYRKLVALSEEKAPEETILEQRDKHLKGLEGYFKDYRPEVDKEVFEKLLNLYYASMPADAIPAYLQKMHDSYNGDFGAMAKDVFSESMFVSEEKLSEFLEDYKRSRYKKIKKDAAYQLAEGFSDLYYNTYVPEMRSAQKESDSLMRLYMKAQIEMQPDKRFYPDANFTLRVGYGKVMGFSPDDARNYRYYTTLMGIMEKEDPEIYDYVVEDQLKTLYKSRDYGPYGEEDGTMRVCFIATNHTTGGNSGSPVLDADGNLIGLNFDRCWESVMSDYYFDISQCRNIALDIRYCLFIIDKFAGAGHLVDEMTLVNEPQTNIE
jgi:hypothetical protein